jgi:uridylate kinase
MNYSDTTIKTAISIDRGTWFAADALADEMGVSRSRLYALALQEYLARHTALMVKERLDEVYAADPDENEEKVLRGARSAQRRILGKRNDA